MELKEAFQVLNKMMNTFEMWFPMGESETKEQIELWEVRFANTKLSLEIGEYTRDDYEYLSYLHGIVTENALYHEAIGTFIAALSEEYGRNIGWSPFSDLGDWGDWSDTDDQSEE